jgi:hypothetical protein
LSGDLVPATLYNDWHVCWRPGCQRRFLVRKRRPTDDPATPPRWCSTGCRSWGYRSSKRERQDRAGVFVTGLCGCGCAAWTATHTVDLAGVELVASAVCEGRLRQRRRAELHAADVCAACGAPKRRGDVVCDRCMSLVRGSCAGKVRHRRERVAAMSYGGGAYRCRMCEHWHNGRRVPAEQRERIVAAAGVLREGLEPWELRDLLRWWRQSDAYQRSAPKPARQRVG